MGAGKEDYVCKLKKSIYGLRQSARCWNKRLHDVLTKLQFKQSSADPCMYVRDCEGEKVFLLVYVDDMLLMSSSTDELDAVTDGLKKDFEITCLGDVRHFLGMEIHREEGVYSIKLRNYISKLLEDHGMSEAKPAKAPMDPNYVKSEDTSELLKDASRYRSVVGSLLYISVVARPDIANSASLLGRKFAVPTEQDWTAAKRVMRYLKGTINWSLHLSGEEDQALLGYSDADWAGDLASRRSTSGFAFMFSGGTISWTSRGQTSVTLSSMEAEYVALSEACQEAVWLRQLLLDFGEPQKNATTIREDNQGCIAFVKTERVNRRSKHIDTRQKFVQELCSTKQIALEYCSTEQMAADILTKPLGQQKNDRFCTMLGLK